MLIKSCLQVTFDFLLVTLVAAVGWIDMNMVLRVPYRMN